MSGRHPVTGPALLERTVFWIVPAVVLLVAYAGVCQLAGTAWPWNRVVHEDGIRTLVQTVFYFDHATRELVPDILLALAVAGAMHWFLPLSETTGDVSRARWCLGALATGVLALIVGGTLWQDGPQTIVDNLSQLHTREGAPLVWGAHWRYHLIERFAQMVLAYALAGLLWLRQGRPNRGDLGLYASAFVLFGIVTVVFRPTTEPFRDPTFLGHQLRELVTHTLVTLPLTLGVCFELSRGVARPRTADPRAVARPIVIAGSIAVLSGTFLLAASVASGAQSHGQVTGVAALLFPHFFEHALGYLFVPAMAGFAYAWPTPPLRNS